MSIDKIIFYLGAIILVVVLIAKPKKKLKGILILLILFLFFAPLFLPSNLFGKWSSIKELQNKTITTIIIKPYWEESDINLSDTILKVNDANQIAHIKYLLENTTIYRAGHSEQIWQTSMIIITQELDSLKMHIFKTKNQGTHIFKDDNNNSYNQNELGDYLQKMTNFKIPKE